MSSTPDDPGRRLLIISLIGLILTLVFGTLLSPALLLATSVLPDTPLAGVAHTTLILFPFLAVLAIAIGLLQLGRRASLRALPLLALPLADALVYTAAMLYLAFF